MLIQVIMGLGGVLGGLCSSGYEERPFRLACSLVFFGALHLGELVSLVHRTEGLLDADVDLHQDRV